MHRSVLLIFSFVASLSPLLAQVSLKKATSAIKGVFVGHDRSYFLTDDGSLYGSGANEHGQLGDGTKIGKDEFVFIAQNVFKVSVGGYHTMIIKGDGSLWVTGHNGAGQLANNTKTPSAGFIKVMDEVEDVATGLFHSMILKKDGQLLAVGRNEAGNLGVDSKENYIFNLVHTLDSVRSISVSDDNSFAIRYDGSLWGCGSNEYGELGIGKSILSIRKWNKIIDNVKLVRTGLNTTLIVKNDDTCWGVGNSSHGWLGKGVGVAHPYYNSKKFTDTWVKVFDSVKDLTISQKHCFIVTKDDVLWATSYPFVLDGWDTPGGFVKASENVRVFAMKSLHGFILRKDGTILKAGRNSVGELGRLKSRNREEFYREFKVFNPEK